MMPFTQHMMNAFSAWFGTTESWRTQTHLPQSNPPFGHLCPAHSAALLNLFSFQSHAEPLQKTLQNLCQGNKGSAFIPVF